MNHLSMAEAIKFVEHYGYALLFLWVLAEQGALPVPSAPLLIAVGALVRVGKMNGTAAIACCVAAALIADNVWFYFGRRRGKRVLRFLCRVSLSPDSCVHQTENAFLKYGLKTLLVAKFIPGLNSVAAPLAGDSGIGLVRFLAADALGILFWSGAYIGAGYLFADQLEVTLSYIQRTGSWLAIMVAALFALWILMKFVQRRRFLRQLEVARITPEELRDRLDAGDDLYIVDMRGRLENEASVPGAVRLSAEQLAANPAEIPRDREIILFCS
jgi:membrane protein DedA with SNARE-associated domain